MNIIELNTFIENVDVCVMDAMMKIDKNSNGIVFLVDDKKQLAGSLTDGDIRRFLIAGGTVKEKAINAANTEPKYAYSEEEAMQIYHKKNYVAIPILDDNKAIRDIYIATDCIEKQRTKLHVPIVINAGGKGARLEPFTKVLPKPLIPVGELPIIEHIIREYQMFGCEDFHIIVNHKRQLIKAYFAESQNKYHITWYDEEKPLGTGGGLSLLRGKMNETFFFINCDNLLLADYGKILEYHRQKNNAITMVCVKKDFPIPYGVVDLAEDGTIISMKEKPNFSFFTNTGIYVVEPEVLADIEDDTPIGFPEIVQKEMRKGCNVSAFLVDEECWLDMGQLPELKKLRQKLSAE